MRNFVHPLAAVLSLAAAVSVTSSSDVFAQAKQSQMAPAQKQAPAQAAPAQDPVTPPARYSSQAQGQGIGR